MGVESEEERRMGIVTLFAFIWIVDCHGRGNQTRWAMGFEWSSYYHRDKNSLRLLSSVVSTYQVAVERLRIPFHLLELFL